MAEETKPYSPLVSVVIPCYNGAQYLSEALDSILSQSYSNWECIVADDGSMDNSKEVVQAYIKKDSRFKYVYQNNSGPCAARNLGIKVSKGEFLQFLDSDDLIEKDKLKVQVEIFLKNPCDLVYGNMKYFSRRQDGQLEIKENDDKYWKNGKVSGQGDAIVLPLLRGNIMVVDSPIIKRTVFDRVGMWDEQIWFNEDWDVWTRCALAGLCFQFDDTKNTDALVRTHEDSRSRDLFKMFLHGLKVCLKINWVIDKKEYRKIIRPKIYHHIWFLEREILAGYKGNKQLSMDKAKLLYHETRLMRCYIFAWLIRYMPYFLCRAYSTGMSLLYRLKCKMIYES
ncbi:MAG TPA: glycosyltransferase family 2 protein [Bacteroidia bacterium]|jgi:glycosyltransferase involved in cell wall biosynthesis|nr:glycosyltransferase family 2 protein [Bacteroidia bacterium]